MDDFVITNLHESRNEWCSRLVSIFTPLVIEGIRSIYNEAWKICVDKDEPSKYLMTFQNLLARIPNWNSVIIEEEKKRIVERSGCNYLEDLITCVHIIQLKVLTCIRVGNKQKKIDISIPKLDTFIHKIYINAARKIYTNVYLFEKNITPLQVQKNNRELELIIQECILVTIRESVPTESIIRAYMDETVEHEEEVTIENLDDPVITGGNSDSDIKTDTLTSDKNTEKSSNIEVESLDVIPSIKDLDKSEVTTRLTFNNVDRVLDSRNNISNIDAPKTDERLAEISAANALKRKLDEVDDDDDDYDEKIKIHTEDINLGDLEIFDIDKSGNMFSNDIVLDDVMVL